MTQHKRQPGQIRRLTLDGPAIVDVNTRHRIAWTGYAVGRGAHMAIDQEEKDQIIARMVELWNQDQAQPATTTPAPIRFRIIEDPDPDLSWLNETDEDPADHVLLLLIGEQQCPCCDAWRVFDSLGGIDFLIGDFPPPGTYATPADILNAYMRELAEEMIPSPKEQPKSC